jgi:hypothetical protein
MALDRLGFADETLPDSPWPAAGVQRSTKGRVKGNAEGRGTA